MVDLGVQAGGVHALALGVDRGYLELVRLAGTDVAAAPVVLVQIGLDADVGVERGHPDAVVGGAEFTGGLIGLEGEAGVQHARRRGLVHFIPGVDEGVAFVVGLEVVVDEFLLLEGTGVVAEVVVLPALETGRGGGEFEAAVDLQAGARSAIEPADGDVAHAVAVGDDVTVVEVEADVQLVGLDGLHAEGLAEGLSAQVHVHAPAARGGVGGGGEGEVVDIGGAALDGERLGELAVGVAQLGDDRMTGRKRRVVEEGDHADVQRIARTPDAALSEDVGLDAPFVGGAADIKVTGGQRLLVLEVEVGVVLPAGGDQETSFVRSGEADVALAVGLALGEFLLREVVEFDARARHRLAAEDVVGEDLGGAVALLGDEHEVAREQVHAALFVGLIVAEGTVAVPEILFHEGLAAADLDMVDGARFRFHQLVEAQSVGFPLADVVRVAVAQHEGRVGHGTGHLVDLVAGIVVIELHELQNVVAVNFLDAHLRLRIRDGAEEQVEIARGGEDGPLAQETDGGHFGIDVLPGGGGAFVPEAHLGLTGYGGHGRSGGFLGTAALAGGQQAGRCGQRKDETEGFHRIFTTFVLPNVQS